MSDDQRPDGPAAGPEGIAEEDRADLGVLFVHGIGQQSRGETLVLLGEALVRWLERWIGAESAGPVTRIVGRRRAAGDGGDPASAWGVEVTAARLAEGGAEPGRPATAALRVRLPRADGTAAESRWLFAETHWAEEFLPPSFVGLCRWGLFVVPWTLASHLGGRVRRGWKARKQRSPLVALLDLLRVAALLAVVPVAAALGMVAVLVLLLVALVPIPWLRRWLGAVQRALAGTVGDSLVLLESPLQRAAIVGRAVRDLRWLLDRCPKVAVVAHSQGAAIAHEALATGVLAGRRAEDHLLFTFGSGLAKLEEIRWFRRERPAWTGWLAPVGLLLGSASLVAFGWIDVDGLVDRLLGGYLAFLGLGCFFLGAAAAVRGMELDRETLSPERRFGLALRWCDRWAAADPVPNGPLFDPDRTPDYLISEEDANYGSPWADHTVYHRNPDGFVAALAAELARLAGLGLELRPLDAVRLRLGWHRRRFRVRGAAWTRRLALLAAVVAPLALGAAGYLETIGGGLALRLEAAAGAAPKPVYDLLRPALRLESAALGAAAAVACVGLAYLAVAFVWRCWNWDDVQQYFWRHPYRLGAWAYLWAALAVVLLATLMWVAALPFRGPARSGELPLNPAYYLLALFLIGLAIEYLVVWLSFRTWRQDSGVSLLGLPGALHRLLVETYLGASLQGLWVGLLAYYWTLPLVVALWRWLPGEGKSGETARVAVTAAVSAAGVGATRAAWRRLLPRIERLAAVGEPEAALRALDPDAALVTGANPAPPADPLPPGPGAPGGPS